jgi:hypothetical protein
MHIFCVICNYHRPAQTHDADDDADSWGAVTYKLQTKHDTLPYTHDCSHLTQRRL